MKATSNFVDKYVSLYHQNCHSPYSTWFYYKSLLGKADPKGNDLLPVISVAAVTLVAATVVAHNSASIMETGYKVLIVVLLHNLLGYLTGYLLGCVLRLPNIKRKTLSIESDMQNSGLASSLAGTSFPDFTLATVPERFSLYATIFPVHCWRIFSER